MSANRIFLVCQHCPRPEDAYCVGSRDGNDTPYVAGALKRMDDWYEKHARCGSGFDHITLGYAKPHDWDQPTPAPQVASAVRLAIADSTSDGSVQ